MALACLLAQADFIVPIPGTHHVANLEEDAAAAKLGLTPDENARLGEIFAVGAGAGKRYPDAVLEGMGI